MIKKEQEIIEESKVTKAKVTEGFKNGKELALLLKGKTSSIIRTDNNGISSFHLEKPSDGKA